MSYCNSCKSLRCSCLSSCDSCSCLYPNTTDCTSYSGSTISCLDITKGDDLTGIIKKFATAICEAVPGSGYTYILQSCDSNITVSSSTVGTATTFTVCLSSDITSDITQLQTDVESLQTCCDQSITTLISSDGSITVSDEGSNTWDITITPPSGNTYWYTTGNGGLDDSTNFIGTTDSTDLVFKVNNTEAGRLNDTDYNTSFGYLSLNSNISGQFNTAIGGGSLLQLTTGSFNTVVGYACLPDLTTGDSNTVLGKSSGAITTGDDNIIIGRDTGLTLTTGSSNTIIGAIANVNSASSLNRIALGAGAIADSNYQFALPDDVTKWKFRGVSYTLPATDGTAGQALRTDGSGNLYWG